MNKGLVGIEPNPSVEANSRLNQIQISYYNPTQLNEMTQIYFTKITTIFPEG